mmetsp:Transcript_17079/g.20563  ORF Transcript_17079/g.20563 Transcript_17079/m.20563 type:complete len:247 (-) Transcript_17079:1785-2525(-)
MDFFKLSKIRRPSSTPFTMEAKLSSIRIISAASLETSFPAIPMAIPMLPFFSAGASFTPSPVTATTSPRLWLFSTISSFWLGETRAQTICSWSKAASHRAVCFVLSSTVSQSRISSPLMTIALPWSILSWSMIPICLAIALAVIGWSPVTMKTFTRARLHFATASGTPGRGGSMRESRPANTKSPVGKLGSGFWEKANPLGNLTGSSSEYAKPSTRSPREPMPSYALVYSSSSSGVLGIFSPSFIM